MMHYNKVHVTHEALPHNQIDFTQNFDSNFRPLPQIKAPEENFTHHRFVFVPNLKDHIYDQDILENRYKYNETIKQAKDDYIIDESQVLHTLRHALIDLCTVIPQLPSTSPLPHFTAFSHSKKSTQKPVLDNKIALQLKSMPYGSIKLQSPSETFNPKNKSKMF